MDSYDAVPPMRGAPRAERYVKAGGLAALVSERRRQRGLTFRDAAKESGVSAPTLCRVESGKRPDVDTALALCRWLGVTVEYAFTRKTDAPECSRCARTDFVLAGIRADLADLLASQPDGGGA